MSTNVPQQFEIDGVQYSMTPHGVFDGLEVIDVLIEIGLAPALMALTGGEGGAANLDPSALIAGLKSAGGVRRLAPLVLKNTYRVDTRLDAAGIQVAFPGRYGELSKAVWEVIDRNHFFDAVLGLFSEEIGNPSPEKAT